MIIDYKLNVIQFIHNHVDIVSHISKNIFFQFLSSTFNNFSVWLMMCISEPKIGWFQTIWIMIGHSSWAVHIFKNLKLEAYLRVK